MPECVGALIAELIDPEAPFEVRYLNDHRSLFERKNAETVDDVLIGASDEPLLRLDIVAKHRELVTRRHWHDAAHQARLGDVLEGGPPVVQIHHWPGPDISEPAYCLHVFRAHTRAGNPLVRRGVI